MIDELPFLTGEVSPCPYAKKKGVMRIQPGSTATQRIPIVQVKEHPQCVLPSMPTSEKQTRGGTHHARCAQPLRAIIPEFDYSSIPAPVFRAQINVLADGIVLCLTINHMVIDGMGTAALVDMLATACRAGEGSVTDLRRCGKIQDSCRRYFLDLGTQCKLRDGVQHGNTPSPGAEDFIHVGETYATRTLVFSDARIKALKGQCNATLAEMSTATCTRQTKPGMALRDRKSLLSSNDVLTALLWISINQSRSQSREHSCVGVPVSTRTRFCPPLSDHYLGNAVLFVESELAVSEIQGLYDDDHSSELSTEATRTLSLLAYRIRSSITRVDNDHLRQFLSRAHHSSNWEQLLACPADVFVSSVRSWDLASQNFGPTLGGILAVAPVPVSVIEGECIIQPRRCDAKGDDIWEVMVTLKPEDMKALRDNRLMACVLQGDYPVEFYHTTQV